LSEPERRLAAILAADMVGYSRLMEVDEAGTLARLKTHRMELIDPAIARRRGRVIKTMGDGLLVEFPSVVDAVSCALELQGRMARRNADVAPDQRIQFRVGISCGDVIVEAEDMYGEGVNLASRLQAIAAPGAICVTAAVRDHVGERIEAQFEDLGERQLRNMARPVRVYAVAVPGPRPEAWAAPVPERDQEAERPSIVVLPFQDMGGASGQDFFADGLTEDLLTELSRFRELFVISRTSAFAYRDKAVKPPEIARELGVRYVLEGSVRRAGPRLRVTVQLIDAREDRHLWAERYDRSFEDVFAIQDEITATIAATLPGRMRAAAQERIERRKPESLAAYELVLAGKALHHRSNPADNARALALIDRAIGIDPRYGHAHAWRACLLGQQYANGWSDARDRLLAEVSDALGIALSLDENDSDTHRILAAVSIVRDDLAQARHHQTRALALNPNDDLVVVQQGELLTWLGQPEEGIAWIRRAMRLNPYHPERFWSHLARACFVARRHGEALEALGRLSRPDALQHALAAAAASELADDALTARHVAEALRANPELTVAGIIAGTHYALASDLALHREALIAAGFPPG
jgi:adenylate cyclase